jgi:hypothetical protein
VLGDGLVRLKVGGLRRILTGTVGQTELSWNALVRYGFAQGKRGGQKRRANVGMRGGYKHWTLLYYMYSL